MAFDEELSMRMAIKSRFQLVSQNVHSSCSRMRPVWHINSLNLNIHMGIKKNPNSKTSSQSDVGK